MWAQLPESEQRKIIQQVQAALAQLTATDESRKPQYRRHVRFEQGRTVVLNSARRARSDAAWSALAETGRQIQQRKGQR
jgi:hypothetical protein